MIIEIAIGVALGYGAVRFAITLLDAFWLGE
jgi:hypothetical protein